MHEENGQLIKNPKTSQAKISLSKIKVVYGSKVNLELGLEKLIQVENRITRCLGTTQIVAQDDIEV